MGMGLGYSLVSLEISSFLNILKKKEERSMKNKIMGMIIAAAFILPLLGFAQTAEQKLWKSAISEKGWTKDSVIEWKDGGFGIAPNAEKKYGWVENNDKIPFSKNGEVSIEIVKIEDANISMQLQTFDDKGNFIEAVDLIKEVSAPGKQTVTLDKFKVNPKTVNVNFKLWLGSGGGKGNVQIKEITYKY